MYLYSIMPLDTDHVDEVCEDICNQVETGVSNFPLFMMTLVPEGNPDGEPGSTINKAKIMCEKYMLFKKKLDNMGVPNGVLVQASIGHGYPLNNKFPFRSYVNLSDGAETNTCCPSDKDFQKHFYDAFRTIALCHPDVIMLDDDFRLLARPGRGCACPWHMQEFARRTGKKVTREELYGLLNDYSDPENENLRQAFIKMQIDALVEAAKVMREGMDSVDPKLPGVFCGCGSNMEGANEIAKILAGEGNPAIVRINNGNYTPVGARELSRHMFRAALQISNLGEGVDAVLAETDTCPQNRYSTGAYSTHSHFVGTILEGASGAKHWITRLGAYEPASGKVYRQVLSKYSGFYETLSEIVPTLTWQGCRVPLSGRPVYNFDAGDPYRTVPNDWAVCVLERMGLPLYFSKNPGGAVFLNGDADLSFTNDELKDMFKGAFFLASDTAKRLIDRGLGEYLGVDVREWTGRRTSGELVCGNTSKAQMQVCELVPLDENVRADSIVFHIPDGVTKQPLFPGVTVHKNKLGGTTVVFSGTPKARFNFTEAFSFLNESRKKQMIKLLSETGNLPLYYPDDAEVYLRTATMPDGTQFCAFFNIGLDPIDNITLVSEKKVNSIEYLDCDGTRKPCAFTVDENGVITLDIGALTLHPQILFLK